MGEVVCTVNYPKKNQRDLVLPDHIPVHQLVNTLAGALGLPVDREHFYELQLLQGSEPQRIPESRTLQQAYIPNGSLLNLVEVQEAGRAAVLLGDHKLRIRLRENTIIGRLTKESHVDLDLTPLDEAKVVSRRHAVINRVSLHFLIKDMKSHNGTFVNKIRIKENESIVLHSGDEICFGSLEKGVRLTLKML